MEKANSRMKRLGLSILILLGILLLMGPSRVGSRTRVVEAEEFVVQDTNGKVYARLGMQENHPALILYDARGKERVGLDIAYFQATEVGKPGAELFGGPGLWLANESGEPRAGLTLDKSEPYLWLHNPSGGWGATLYVDDKGPKAKLYDKSARVIWHAP